VSTDRRPLASRISRPERLLPFACIAGAATLFASEFMTTFQLSEGPLGSGNPLCNLDAASRHHFALGILAIFAVLFVVVAVVWGSKPAAVAVGIAGVLALLLFLIIDLPKANNVGSISSACDLAGQGFDAKALPQAGFWLEMVGALALALSGVALATLSPEQLATMRPRWLGGGGRKPKPTVLDHRAELEEDDPGQAASGGPADTSSQDARRRKASMARRRT
jgi:hypothetical protein